MVLEMENPRRPFDRSRDPNPIKKPRLAEESVRPPNRPFTQQRTVSSTAAPPARFRGGVREMESNNDPSREAYQPQPLNPHQELVSQYKSALAELTFNSKPIITNLTIIAGENLHAAKAIAATICANIIEVPSDQKLPSLYLLDSIVKNIGRDYIKYFAAKLPEVFCKAYRQVDPPIHTSMRHLFGTWKGVFHPQTLQMIEKELGFASRNDGTSSVVTTSRADPQPQRPAHSIHVNPKYLERQRLQQSGRAKAMVNDVPGVTTSGDAYRLERTSSLTSGGSWIEPSVRLNSIQRPQRDALSEPLYEKDIGAAPGEYELSHNSRFGISKIGGRIVEDGHDKPWYGARGNIPELTSPRDVLNAKNRIANYSTTKSANADIHLQPTAGRNNIGMSSSWKHSEEEEFMWDMHSRLSENDVANISSHSKNDVWTPDESEKLESENHIFRPPRIQEARSRLDPDQLSMDSLSSEHKDQTLYGPRTSSRPSHDGVIRPGVSIRNSAHSEGCSSAIGGLPPRKGIQTQVSSSRVGASSPGIFKQSASGSAGSVGAERFQALGAASPSRQSPTQTASGPGIFKQSASGSAGSVGAERFQALGAASPSRQSPTQTSAKQDYRRPNSLPRRDPRVSHFPGKPHDISSDDSLQTLPSSTQFRNSQMLDLPAASRLKNFETPSTAENAAGLSSPLPVETSGQSNMSSLLAAVMKSGILSNNLVSGGTKDKTFEDEEKPASTSLLSPGSHDGTSAGIKIEEPPLLPDLTPPPLAAATSTRTSDEKSKASDPISNLLNSLVSKGLISASKTESASLLPSQLPSRTRDQSPENSTSSSLSVSAVPISSDLQPAASVDKGSPAAPVGRASSTPSQPTKMEVENLIGFQFRPDIIREFHPSVISGLFDDLPYNCSICSLHLKRKDQLDRHLESHTKKMIGPNDADRGSWVWFPKADDWLVGKAGLMEPESACSSGESGTVKEDELMVPADENQYACILCGDMFEDYFCQESDQWMFRGAVCMTIPSADTDAGIIDGAASRGPIVHANCLTEDSMQDLGFGSAIKQANS